MSDTTDIIRERIERGAAWLDDVEPGWRSLLDLEDLHLSSNDSCVLGQVFREQAWDSGYEADGYNYVLESGDFPDIPSESDTWAREHGFEAVALGAADKVTYSALETAWQRYLTNTQG